MSLTRSLVTRKKIPYIRKYVPEIETSDNPKFDPINNLPVSSNPNEDSSAEKQMISQGYEVDGFGLDLNKAMVNFRDQENEKLREIQLEGNEFLQSLEQDQKNEIAQGLRNEDENIWRNLVYDTSVNIGLSPNAARNIAFTSEFIPGPGDASIFIDGINDFKNGKIGSGAFNTALGVVGLIPAAEIFTKALRKTKINKTELDSVSTKKMIIGTNTEDLGAIRDLTNNAFKSMPYVPGATRTGWTNLNGRAVYEISDSAAGMNTSLLKTDVGKTIDFKDYDTYHAIFENGDVPKSLIETYSIKTIKLRELLKHDELFKAYPELKNVTVRLNVDEGRGIMGSAGFNLMETTGDSFTLGSTINIAPVWKYIDPKTLKLNEKLYQKTLLHEIQHIIQRMESLPRGSSTEISGLKLMDWFDALPPGKTKDIISKDLAKNFEGFGNFDPKVYPKIGSNNLPESVRMYIYRMAGGEITSRVTEESMDLTVKELIETPLLNRIQAAKQKALNDPRILESDKSGPIQTKEFDKIVGEKGLEDITDPKEIVFDNFNFPSSSMEDIKKFIKTKFKKIPELKFISKLKKGTPITFGGKKYIFKEFKMGTWNPSEQYNFNPEFIVNPGIRHADRSLIDENFTGPMVIMRNENGELSNIPVLSLANDLSKESALKLRVELNKFYKPGLMSKIYTKLGGPN
tara:strand:- start:604 stop:2661 length:2058 start_codon:yes stop_codon:yes gene_type:complete